MGDTSILFGTLTHACMHMQLCAYMHAWVLACMCVHAPSPVSQNSLYKASLCTALRKLCIIITAILGVIIIYKLH